MIHIRKSRSERNKKLGGEIKLFLPRVYEKAPLVVETHSKFRYVISAIYRLFN